MAEPKAQSFENHGQYRPEYHLGVFFILLANFLWSTYQLVRGFSAGTLLGFLMSVAFVVMFFSLRVQILTVQDRVIRLEMRIRMARLGLDQECDRLAPRQLIALRFASDSEMSSLAHRAIAEKLTPDQIKRAVIDWQGDYFRT